MSGDRELSGIAIVGMACRLPGATDYRQFWRNLCNGVESVTVFSEAELLAAGVDPALVRHPEYVKAAFSIPGIDRFDAAFFEYSPHETRLIDPQHRLLLEVAWETFEDAGCRPGRQNGPVGVFVGLGGNVTSYLMNEMADHPEARGRTANLVHIGNDKDFAGTRISYKFDLTGPSVNVQTACSTSLVLVHLACQSIRAGECSMALAGAATVRVPERSGYLGIKGGLYSPDGRVRTFDADARGTVFGSGVAAVLLKDLKRARADGDHIYAVIKGTAVNNDGSQKASYSGSSVNGQAEAMTAAMAAAGFAPETLGYVECHGTGTMIGDPIEIAALTQSFRARTERRGFCPVGSVKPNIGHPEQAAGLASFIKTVLAVEQGVIPPTINLRTLNPRIDFESSPFFVNTELRDWSAENGPRRALVNSLGIGGTNGVVVLEQAPAPAPVTPATSATSATSLESGGERPQHLFVFSAKSPQALSDLAARYRVWIEATPEATSRDLGDIGHTLGVGRAHFPFRFTAVAATPGELAERLRAGVGTPLRPDANRKVAFLYSGQGAQFPGMARALYDAQPVFRAALDRCAAAMQAHLDPPLLEILFASDPAQAERIHQTGYTQPALFAVEYALAELLGAWGIRPDAVLGHSVGEFAAACLAGVYTLEQAAALICARGRLMQALPEGGVMAAVFADEATVRAAIGASGASDIGVAAVNGPQSTVISGSGAAVEAVRTRLEAQGAVVRPLKVSHAFHSPLMDPMLEDFRHTVAAVPAQAPQVAWMSTLTGQPMIAAPDAAYWCSHAREAVRMMDGVRALAAMGITDFIEIGPGRTLLTLGQMCVEGAALAWMPTLGKDGTPWQDLLETVGTLYRRGQEIDWPAFDAPYGYRRRPLPTYPFQHESFWVEKDYLPLTLRGSGSGRSGVSAGLAGMRLRSALPGAQFETLLSRVHPRWMEDHRVYGRVVLPTTAGLVALLDAAQAYLGDSNLALTGFSYQEALVLGDSEERMVQILVSPEEGTQADIRLASAHDDATDAPWRTHMLGTVHRDAALPGSEGGAPFAADVVRRRCQPLETQLFYAGLTALGLPYGPAFRGIQELWRGRDEALSRVRLPDEALTDMSSSVASGEPSSGGSGSGTLHPALLDACLHIYPALIAEYGDFTAPPAAPAGGTHLPAAIERFALAAAATAETRDVWVHARRRPDSYPAPDTVSEDSEDSEERDAGIVVVDIDVYGLDGRSLASFEGLMVRPVPASALGIDEAAADSAAADGWLYQIRWDERPSAAPATAATGTPPSWLIFADHAGVGMELAEALERKGQRAQLVVPAALRADGEDDAANARADAADGITETAAGELIIDSPAPFVRALETFAEKAGTAPFGVVHLWALDAAPEEDPLEPAQQRVLGSALRLTQAIQEVRSRGTATPRLWLATRNAMTTGKATDTDDGEPPAAVVQAGLWGFGRSVALEDPQIWGGLVDLEAHPDAIGSNSDGDAEDAAALCAHLLAADGEAQVAIRDGRRLVARLVRAAQPEESRAAAGEGTYLITGGLGALGIEVAKALIQRRGIRHLVLASRRGSEDPAARAVRQELEALGATVSVSKADTSREADVKRLMQRLRRASPPLKGIIHSAGVLDDGMLGQMDWAKFRRALAPKVDAAWFLHQYSRDLPLDHFVVFSSILGVTGAAGQTNYTAGNTSLDALAAHRRRLGLPGLSINWGPWAARGLATLSGEQGEAIWRARGLLFIPPELGQESFNAVLDLDLDHAAISLMDWPALFGQFTAPPPFYAEMAEEADDAGGTSSGLGAEIGALQTRLRSTDPGERRAAILEFVGQQAVSTLGLSRPVDPTQPLRELGLDSLMAVTLINRVEAALGVRIPAVKLIQGPSVAQLVDDVWPELKSAGPAAAAVGGGAVRSHGEAALSAARVGMGAGAIGGGGESGAGIPRAAQGEHRATNGAARHGSGTAAGSWLVVVGPRARPRHRLFCFPFAGGGSAVFRDWASWLDPSIEVVAVEPPGRLSRITEKPVHEMGVFVDQVLEAMAPRLDLPFALFGHCLGALTMYESARALLARTPFRPRHLFCSGARAPDRVDTIGPFEKKLGRRLMAMRGYKPQLPPYRQPDPVFAEMVRQFDMAATDQFLDDPELRRLMLPAVRAEFEMTSKYRFVPMRPWDVPITCFVSRGDPYVSREDVLGWGRFTNHSLQVHIREGSHYSVVEDAKFLTRMINQEMMSLAV